jgi:hypothetical protein
MAQNQTTTSFNSFACGSIFDNSTSTSHLPTDGTGKI